MWLLPVRFRVQYRQVQHRQVRYRLLRGPPVFLAHPFLRAPRLRALLLLGLLPALPLRRDRLERVRWWVSRKRVPPFRLGQIWYSG
jgi:hypothetical protein